MERGEHRSASSPSWATLHIQLGGGREIQIQSIPGRLWVRNFHELHKTRECPPPPKWKASLNLRTVTQSASTTFHQII